MRDSERSTESPGDAGAELSARRAASFGAVAAAYAEHRPDYPAAAIRWALAPVSEAGHPEVLDLGAGTGKLTEGLLELDARVTAVEPDAGMRAEFARRLKETPIFAGTAESIPLPDHSVHAVVAGQAFHWFDQARAFPEIARVLRPGGVFAAVWNTTDTSVDWVAELDSLSRSPASSPATTAEALPAHPLFEPFESTDVPHVQRRTAESLVATIGTHSHTLVIGARERATLLARLTEYLRGRPETGTGEFDMPLRTRIIRAAVR
ncbi:class I SAM-dependent methyltransferase [Nocardia sp. alder85J]|uniref:class I SAM-dependent methyltransferase n=1 Tax=Nocardia sp. alder85J TaxID=2862949 RepID=UPI001CD58351|nr:class I SAM-dependent methyltransferase [Nocardia sp. alder85J]MCX4096417.1 class I SAM-dependent methyltransferase [Nocardia sp. alder85J]